MNVLLAALLLALVVVGARKARRTWLEWRLAQLRAATPGLTPDNPLQLSSWKDLDPAVERFRCSCGEPLVRLGETTRMGVRVVRCTCRACEQDTDLYFLMPPLLN